jgi:hypothetical protein
MNSNLVIGRSGHRVIWPNFVSDFDACHSRFGYDVVSGSSTQTFNDPITRSPDEPIF